MVLQWQETRPRVHNFTSASSLNNNNVDRSYNNPQHATKSHSKATNNREQTKRLWKGTKPPQSYSFGSIYHRVRARITP